MEETTERYFLRKEDRLKSKKIIDALFKTGNSFSNFPFRVLWLPENNLAELQAGVGVSSRSFKKATDRNHIKRLMREAYRLQKNQLAKQLTAKEKQMSVFILYTGKEIPDYKLVHEKIGIIIRRLLKHLNEKDQSDTQ